MIRATTNHSLSVVCYVRQPFQISIGGTATQSIAIAACEHTLYDFLHHTIRYSIVTRHCNVLSRLFLPSSVVATDSLGPDTKCANL